MNFTINRKVVRTYNVTFDVNSAGEFTVNGVPHFRPRGKGEDAGLISRLRVPYEKRVQGLRYLDDGRWAIPV